MADKKESFIDRVNNATRNYYNNMFKNKKDTPAPSAIRNRNRQFEEITGDAATFLRANRGANRLESEDTNKNYHQIKNKFKYSD